MGSYEGRIFVVSQSLLSEYLLITKKTRLFYRGETWQRLEQTNQCLTSRMHWEHSFAFVISPRHVHSESKGEETSDSVQLRDMSQNWFAVLKSIMVMKIKKTLNSCTRVKMVVDKIVGCNHESVCHRGYDWENVRTWNGFQTTECSNAFL